jgi:hypothetical protein
MSPIFEQQDYAFKEIGRLRKGAPKTEGLKDLKYFRPDFRPDEASAESRFMDAYGGQPTRINIRLAFPEVNRCWQCWFMAYNKHGLLAKAGVVPGKEGWWFIYLRHNRTGELLVKDGEPEKPFDPKVPIYSYESKKGEDVAVYAKPEGRLNFMIPELKMVSYMTLITHSWYDCAKIEAQLNGIRELAERVGMSLPLVPLVLTRRPETVSISFDGHKKMEEKWIVNIDVREDWGEKQFLLLDQITPGALLPAPRALPELPAGLKEENWGDEPEIFPEPDDEPEPTGIFPPPEAATVTPPPTDLPKTNGNGERPYPLAKIKEKLAAAAPQYANKKPSDKQIGLVAMLIEKAFAGQDNAPTLRHDVQFAIFGYESLKDVEGGLVLAALNNWLQPKQDSGGDYFPDPMAVREIQRIVNESLVAEGQQSLF